MTTQPREPVKIANSEEADAPQKSLGPKFNNRHKAEIYTTSFATYDTTDPSFPPPSRRPKLSAHETSLREELRRFQREIEQKFCSSSVNRAYVFPKTTNMDENGSPDSIAPMSDDVVPVSIYGREEQTSLLSSSNSKVSERTVLPRGLFHNARDVANSELYRRVQEVLRSGTRRRIQGEMSNAGNTLKNSPFAMCLKNDAPELRPYSDLNASSLLTVIKSSAPKSRGMRLKQQLLGLSSSNQKKQTTKLPLLMMRLDPISTHMHMRTRTIENVGKSLVLKKGKKFKIESPEEYFNSLVTTGRTAAGMKMKKPHLSSNTLKRMCKYRKALNESVCGNNSKDSSYEQAISRYRSYLQQRE